MRAPFAIPGLCLLALAAGLFSGCRSPARYVQQADEVAARHIKTGQDKALGRNEPFTIEKPSDTLRRRLLASQNLPALNPAPPSTNAIPLPDPLVLALNDALRLGAAQSRDYQSSKESVFQTALSLDLEADAFRNSFAGALGTLFSSDRSGGSEKRQIDGTGSAGVTRKLQAGATLTSRLAFDLAKLLTGDKDSNFGLAADASVTIPLLRGAGRAIATEPLTQAERNLVYSIRRFELYKQEFAVRLASDYLSVLQRLQAVHDAESNLSSVSNAFERARQLSDSGRLPGIQVDQARQDVLRAETRVTSARQSFEGGLDDFKIALGLPADARVALVEAELTGLAGSGTNSLTTAARAPAPITEAAALSLAFTNRLDLQTVADAVADAERGEKIARDALRAGLTLRGSASVRDSQDELTSQALSGVSLNAHRGRYGVGLEYDAPWERTAERNAYRNSLIALDEARRNFEEKEDRVKLEVRDGLRNLAVAEESCRIQAQAVDLARARVISTQIYLQAGRAEIRDLLEAQAALVNTQDALTGAVVTRRLAELNLQRTLGVLMVNPEGLWREYDYATAQNAPE